MTRFLSSCVAVLALLGCGDDAAPTCEPNPCGACRPGCEAADTCTADGWSCQCLCTDGGGTDGGGSDGGSADSGLSDTGALDGGGTDAARDSASDAAPDSSVPDASNPDGCPADGVGMCEPMGLECRYDDRVCTCQPPCSGVDPGPDPPHSWACANRPLACPPTTPIHGSACRTAGLSCTYGTCGGSTAACAGGMWVVTFLPPPA